VTFNDSLPATNVVYTINAGTVLSVNGTLTLSSGGPNVAADVINTGTLNALGDITVADTGGGMGGNAILQIGGAGTQTLTGAGSTTLGNLPTINIAKPSGTLNLASTIRTSNNWTYTSGTINPGSSTVVFAASLTITGTHTLGNVMFNDILPATGTTYTIAAGTTLSASGTLTLSSGGINASGDAINTGTLNALGDVTIADSGGGIGGTATLQIGGNGNQNFTGGGSATLGNLPRVNIAKTGGTLTLLSILRTASNWIYTSGTIKSRNEHRRLRRDFDDHRFAHAGQRDLQRQPAGVEFNLHHLNGHHSICQQHANALQRRSRHI